MAATRLQGHAPRLLLLLGISSTVLIASVTGGILTNSLALLADAGHVLTDVAGVSLALIAMWSSARPGGERRTFGYPRWRRSADSSWKVECEVAHR